MPATENGVQRGGKVVYKGEVGRWKHALAVFTPSKLNYPLRNKAERRELLELLNKVFAI